MTESFDLIGLGELLWDCFPDLRRPGGAPANVAFHAQQLGLTAAVATRVGNDDLGNELCHFLVSQGLNIELVQQDPRNPTGTVTIVPDSTATVKYSFLKNSAWDFLKFNEKLSDAVCQTKAICFGTLAQRISESRTSIQKSLALAPSESLIVYDVNLRPPHFARDWIANSMKQATIVKMNHEEVSVLAPLLGFPSTNEVRFAKWLLDSHKKLKFVCVTRGGEGCMAVTCEETIELPGIAVNVVDTVGAGDAFTAAIIFGQLKNWPLVRTLELANRYGSLVASRPGAMPDLREELTQLKSNLEWSFRNTPMGN